MILLLVSAAAASPSAARAQGADAFPEPADTSTAPGPARCSGEIVREITIYAAAPTVARTNRVPILGAIARSTHVTTQPEIIRGFLLLREGDRCTELARAESERVLRVQPFIADASIEAVPVSDGVRLDVRTSDEASLVLGGRMQAGSPYVRSVRVGNSNLAGEGLHVQTEWRDGQAIRDGGSLRWTDHQFLGRPHALQLHASRAPLGGEWHALLTRPYFTGLQRQAWRIGGGEVVGYSELQHPDSATHAVRVDRSYADAGIMGRLGPPVRMALVGLLLSHERERVDTSLRAFGEHGTESVVGAYGAPAPYRSSRVNLFVGVRNLSFVRVHGFDALTATQDIPTGFQAGVVVGRGLETPPDGSGDRELFLAGDLYFGMGDTARATRVQLRAQGVRAAGTGDWGRSIATGRIAHQQKPATNHMLELSADWAATFFPGTPRQLLLGAERGGVRGYDDARSGGSRRARVTLEERYTIPDVKRLGDLGVATFVDAGRVWRGDAPFGVTTPVRTSIGFSVLAAVPVRSARVWRLDVALPLDGTRRVEVGLRRGDRTEVFWREPDDVSQLRGRSVPGSVFAWP